MHALNSFLQITKKKEGKKKKKKKKKRLCLTEWSEFSFCFQTLYISNFYKQKYISGCFLQSRASAPVVYHVGKMLHVICLCCFPWKYRPPIARNILEYVFIDANHLYEICRKKVKIPTILMFKF